MEQQKTTLRIPTNIMEEVELWSLKNVDNLRYWGIDTLLEKWLRIVKPIITNSFWDPGSTRQSFEDCDAKTC